MALEENSLRAGCGEDGLFGLYHGFTLFVFRILDGVVKNTLGFLLGAAQLLLRNILAVDAVHHGANEKSRNSNKGINQCGVCFFDFCLSRKGKFLDRKALEIYNRFGVN